MSSAMDGIALVAPAARAADQRPYFARPAVLGLIFAAFPLITLPLAYITLFPPSPGFRWFATAYLWCLGISHFLITFSIYLNSKNLQYFASTAKNKLVYFGVPALIFAWFGMASLLNAKAHPIAGTAIHVVTVIVSLATFTHLGRQSFGILQILKGQSGLKFDPQMRRIELGFFFVLPILQSETMFLGNGRFLASSPIVWVTVLLALGLFASIIRLGLRAPGEGQKRIVPLVYFCVQTASQCLSAIDMRLYLAGDATHYTEYHTIMYPRVTRGELGNAPVDRVMMWLRKPPALFYFVLLTGSAIAVCFFGDHFGFKTMVMEGPKPFGVFLNMLNGIFLFHFFVEAFIWKFSNPYYRGALSGLYFPKRPG